MLRRAAKLAFEKAITAANPASAVHTQLVFSDNILSINYHNNSKSIQKRTADWKNVYVVSFGKAAVEMALAAVEIIPSDLLAGKPTVITNYENSRVQPSLDIYTSSHPIPDECGVFASNIVAKKIKSAKRGDLVLVLVSGGASALLPFPAEGLSLNDKIATTELLLASGANINEINTVRKHLSRLKGGQIASLASPADLHGMILSDVIGDDLSAVASGPTVPDPTTFRDAWNILCQRNILTKVPKPIVCHLEKGINFAIPDTPKSSDSIFNTVTNSLVGSNAISLSAVQNNLLDNGFTVHVIDSALVGEARAAAEKFPISQRSHSAPGRYAYIAGGETTVTLNGSGKGGRNQELALALACYMEHENVTYDWVFLSGGTDGIDGPTDAAGGCVDSGTLDRIRGAELNPHDLLNNNDAYHALQAAGDLIKIGATGTNVADIQIFLVQKKST